MENPSPLQNRLAHPQGAITGLRIFQTTLSVAILLATLFTAWPIPTLLSSQLSQKLTLLLTPQPAGESVPTSQRNLRIGIVSGHWMYDSGAVCSNGTDEAHVNLTIASSVQQKLKAMGFQADLLKEFDSQLEGYQATALISIHNDSCEYVNDQASGFKVAAAIGNFDPNRASRMTACIIDRYQHVTNLPFHAGSITSDMREYHAFDEIDPNTTAVIIETGFLNLDYHILTEQPELVADGIIAGILCYVNNENIAPTSTPPSNP